MKRNWESGTEGTGFKAWINSMFGLFSKKKRPQNALDEFIFAVYGNPPPVKRADVNEAARLAFTELLMENIEESAIQQQTRVLASGPIPYSTHVGCSQLFQAP